MLTEWMNFKFCMFLSRKIFCAFRELVTGKGFKRVSVGNNGDA